jgi:hypothetical protein
MSIEEAVAREHIRDTMARYNIAGDRRDLKAFVAVFAEDAIFESPIFTFNGRAEIEAKLSVNWFITPTRPVAKFSRHNLTTCQIDLTGPRTAKSRAYYMVVTDLGPDHSGYYVDEFREENGRWLIAHRGVCMEWCHPDSLFVPEKSKKMLAETGVCAPKSWAATGPR